MLKQIRKHSLQMVTKHTYVVLCLALLVAPIMAQSQKIYHTDPNTRNDRLTERILATDGKMKSNQSAVSSLWNGYGNSVAVEVAERSDQPVWTPITVLSKHSVSLDARFKFVRIATQTTSGSVNRTFTLTSGKSYSVVWMTQEKFWAIKEER